MLEEALDQLPLIWHIEDSEYSFHGWLGCVLEILDILADDLSIGNEEALPVYHVAHKHDLVTRRIWEFESCFSGLQIISQNSEIWLSEEVSS